MTGLAGLLSNRYYQDDIPDQRGRTAIVTGGTAGIGRQIAKGLAVAGARGEGSQLDFIMSEAF